MKNISSYLNEIYAFQPWKLLLSSTWCSNLQQAAGIHKESVLEERLRGGNSLVLKYIGCKGFLKFRHEQWKFSFGLHGLLAG